MSRRRARSRIGSELPIIARSPLEFIEAVGASNSSLRNPSNGSALRLAAIAALYWDGRALEEARTPRPDSRKTLEVLAARADGANAILRNLTPDCAKTLDRLAESFLPPYSPSDRVDLRATAMVELSEHTSAQLPLLQSDRERQSVAEFLAHLGDLGDRLSQMPMDSEWALIELAQYDDTLPRSSDSSYLRFLLGDLAARSMVAAEMMKTRRGPRSGTILLRAVMELKIVFEEEGQTATHYVKDDGERSAVSAFDKFVHAFFDGIDPADRHHRGLNDAIAFVCRPGRWLDKEQNVHDGERRQQQITAHLRKAGVTIFSRA